MEKECKDKCLSAGISLLREQQSFRAEATTPILFADNVKGLVSAEDMKVPHSELAMHVGAAGKDLLAWVVTRNYAFIVYDDEGCCEFTHGRIDEVLSPGAVKTTKAHWGPHFPIMTEEYLPPEYRGTR